MGACGVTGKNVGGGWKNGKENEELDEGSHLENGIFTNMEIEFGNEDQNKVHSIGRLPNTVRKTSF